MAHKLTSITAPAKYLSPRIFLMCALLSLTPTLGDSCAVINCTTVNTLWTGLTFTKSFAELNAELKNLSMHTTTPVEGLALDVDAVLEDTVCELVAVYDLLEKVESCSPFQSVLRENIHDGCQWLHYKTTCNPSSQLSTADCDPRNTTEIHRYCLHKKLKEPNLKNVIHNSIDYLSTIRSGTCYSTSPPDKKEEQKIWVTNSSLIPQYQREGIAQLVEDNTTILSSSGMYMC